MQKLVRSIGGGCHPPPPESATDLARLLLVLFMS